MTAIKRICVYAGANPGNDERYRQAAGVLARDLARHGIGIVYGGGNVGLMGELADAALGAGGEVIGIMPHQLVDREIAHGGLTELKVVDSMHERKATMADLSDAFIALPGGIGTLEEIIEIYTWSQLGLHQKACAVLNVGGYYDGLTAFLDHAVTEGFLSGRHRKLLVVVEHPDEVIPTLERWEPPPVDRVLDREGA
jgi:uncharacterized protein (TIGR00730 family)